MDWWISELETSIEGIFQLAMFDWRINLLIVWFNDRENPQSSVNPKPIQHGAIFIGRSKTKCAASG